MSLAFPTVANPLPRMLQVRDPLADGLGRRITHLRLALVAPCSPACGTCRLHRDGPPDPEGPTLTRSQVIQLVQVFASLGVRRVGLTGGDPLRRRDLEPLVAGIAAEMEGRVHLTTHGLALARRAPGLRVAGLGAVTVSLDAATPEAFRRLTGRGGLGRVLAGLDAARREGLQTRLTSVVARGWNEDQVVPLARLAQREGLEIWFREFAPAPGSDAERLQVVPAGDILQMLRRGLDADLPEGAPIDLEEGPARRFDLPGGPGQVGIIASLGPEACDRCNRVRITRSGALKACVYTPEAVDLLAPLRHPATHEQVVRLVRQALAAKRACHPLLDEGPGTPAELWRMGG